MTMAIFRDDGSEQYDFLIVPNTCEQGPTMVSSTSIVPLIGSKLQTPSTRGLFRRDWLLGLLERSSRNAAATILIGRAGSGKTALAADFATNAIVHSWYSVDSTDADWASFQKYFRAALMPKPERRKSRVEEADELIFSSSPMELFADLTAAMELKGQNWPAVLVLDGVHHLYDCEWFDEFFLYLVPSLPHDSHVILISRSKPTAPVWRMRSKQVLNVIDEKLLAFSLAETSELFARRGLSKALASRAHSETFGRPAEVMTYLETVSTV